MKKLTIIGFLGTQLDAGWSDTRWERWRPTVDITRHENLLVNTLVLLHDARSLRLVAQVKADIASVSPETVVQPILFNLRDPWDFGDMYAALFDFAQTFPFDTEHNEYWVHITTGTHVAQICWFLMVEARYIPALLLQTTPPRKKELNSPGSYTLTDLDLSRYDAIAQRFARAHDEAVRLLKSNIATRNTAFNQLINEVERVAIRSKAPMLFMGPTGAGKSFLARRVYELKKARHQLTGRFVEVNCATLRGDGAASALFGHVKGAFTGALADRPGLLKSANKGLLFLDEIGELGLDEQAMLLKAIEEKTFYPIGSDVETGSDFQLITGTHRDLRNDVNAGRFREDLYARINLWSYLLPGLAERPEDIEPNLDYLLAQQAVELGHNVSFNKEAKQRYLAFATSPHALWSGNFRDLSASVMRMATLAEGGRIASRQVDDEIQRLQRLWQVNQTTPANQLNRLFTEQQLNELDLFDRLQLNAVIEVCLTSNSLSDAGRKLFAVSRSQRDSANDADRLRKYLAKFGLAWATITNS